MEIWKDIPEYEGFYMISNLGQVKSLSRIVNYKIAGKTRVVNSRLRSFDIRSGYNYVTLSKYGKTKRYLVHRLVASTFIDNSYIKPQVNHKNGIKLDNRVENLEWCTSSENNKHAHNTGLNTGPKTCGENCKASKLLESDVLDIRSKFIPRKYSERKLAKEYGVTKGCINSILTKKTWKHI